MKVSWKIGPCCEKAVYGVAFSKGISQNSGNGGIVICPETMFIAVGMGSMGEGPTSLGSFFGISLSYKL